MTENRLPNETLDNAIGVYKITIEAVEKQKDSDYCTSLDKVTVAFLEELKAYRAIGTVEEFKALKEKNEPKKPDYEGDGYADGKLTYDYAKCPICGHDFEYGINDWEAEYCSDCGQKLDWSE